MVFLEILKETGRAMVKTLVEMEASFLSANIFRHIMELQAKAGTSAEARAQLNSNFKTLSGREITDRIDEGASSAAYLKKIGSQVSAYLNFVRRQLMNTIPKAVVHTQVC